NEGQRMNRSSDTLTIGGLARQSGVNIDTVRYYERRRLVPKPSRSVSGYRKFPREMVTRIRFIKHAQALGFTLKEIGDLLSLRIESDATCRSVRSRAEAKIADITGKIRSLERMK